MQSQGRGMIRNESATSTAKDRLADSVPSGIRYSLIALAIAMPITGFVVAVTYCFATGGGWRAAALALMTAAAGMTVGLFFGFLFAVPRSSVPAERDRSEASQDAGGFRRLLPNSNLEQVSDWLTKIIVGVTLVQFRGLLDAFSNTVESYVGAFGGEASQDRLMASAILVFFPVFGFLASYLGTRTMVTILLEAISSTDGEEHLPPKDETPQGPM